jgi:hypothetical protein
MIADFCQLLIRNLVRAMSPIDGFDPPRDEYELSSTAPEREAPLWLGSQRLNPKKDPR